MFQYYGAQETIKLERERLERRLQSAWMFSQHDGAQGAKAITAHFTRLPRALVKYLRNRKWVT